VKVKNGAKVKAGARVRANVGNLQEAEWLKPAEGLAGGVSLTVTGAAKFCAPILADTPYLEDAETEWFELSVPGEYSLRMEASERSAFGEVWKITVEA
jgi:hypothetical protein